MWPHPLTFEPFGVDLFDEVGVDVSCYELGLGEDVPQHWDVVVDTCGEREGTCSVSNHHCAHACVCLLGPTIYQNFKRVHLNFNITKIELMHLVGDCEGLLPECSVSYITWSDDLSSWGEPE